MKILIFSDVHGREDRVRSLLALHKSADAVLFLGDGFRDLPDSIAYGKWQFAAVRGNCDLLWGNSANLSLPNEQILRFGAYTVMMTHGHAYGVKGGIEQAALSAAEKGADLLLYGHTHVSEERYLPEGTVVGEATLTKPLWIMNPGSLGAPRNGQPSYGLIQIKNSQLLLSHGTLSD